MTWCDDPDRFVMERLAELDAADVALPEAEREIIAAMLRRVAVLDEPAGMVGAVARLSQDRRDGAGNARQVADILALALREQLAVAELFIDTDRSASRFATRRRERYDAALQMLIDGELGGLVAYNLDRLWRRPADAEKVFERVLTRRARCWSCQGIDLRTADDVLQARILVSVSANESEGTSRRTRRAMETTVERGVPHGGRLPYGRKRALDPNGRPRGEWLVDDVEADIVREACRRVLAGEALSAIARDLNSRGIPTKFGATWRHTTVRSIVSSAHVAGLRAWQPGEVVDGKRSPVGPTTYRRAETLEPIVDEETWRAVVTALADPSRVTTVEGGGGSRRWLGPGFLVCGRCGGQMGSKSGRSRKGTLIHSYTCRVCKRVRRSTASVDQFLAAAVIEWLARAGATPTDPAGVSAAKGDLDRVRAERAELARLLADGKLSATGFAVADAALGDREASAEATLLAGRRKRPVRALTRADIVAEWDAADLAGRRELAAAAGLEVVVAPVGRGRRPRFEGLTVRRRAASTASS
jgi:site-specific DNA recombinase